MPTIGHFSGFFFHHFPFLLLFLLIARHILVTCISQLQKSSMSVFFNFPLPFHCPFPSIFLASRVPATFSLFSFSFPCHFHFSHFLAIFVPFLCHLLIFSPPLHCRFLAHSLQSLCHSPSITLPFPLCRFLALSIQSFCHLPSITLPFRLHGPFL